MRGSSALRWQGFDGRLRGCQGRTFPPNPLRRLQPVDVSNYIFVVLVFEMGREVGESPSLLTFYVMFKRFAVHEEEKFESGDCSTTAVHEKTKK
jgi:hypothetical protein